MRTNAWARSARCYAAGVAWLLLALAALPSAGAGEPDVRQDAAVRAVAKVMPAVVNIGTETVVEVRDPWEGTLREFWGPFYRRRAPREASYSLGSGVIIDEAGYAITNDHVVRRASRIWVKLSDEAGGKEYEAELVNGTSRTDIALLKIKAGPGERFRAARFAADDDLLLGETVLALGNPFGLGGSVSRGILSSKSRRPPVENLPLRIEDWLQTDAAINPGNSGGPLINLRGEVIGLNVAMFRDAQGIGFAIPIKRVTAALADTASSELKDLWFGARVRPGSPLVVSAVEPGSPAEKAGLKAGDVIESINGRNPNGYIDFIRALGAEGDRREVGLVLERGGAKRTAAVRLIKESSVFNAALIRQKLGISVQEVTPDLAEQLGLVTQDGLLVAAVDRDGPAAGSGLQRGSVILALEGGEVENLVSAAKLLSHKRKGEKVSLQVLSQVRRGAFIVHRQGEVELSVR